ncbi:hypothetical protein [Natrinema sp. J7-1]|uniref:hypothetical protein n=1 Tax=Natrinema sp. J7-1 TaxID=1172566 RepID=UPI000B10267E|nr:hypothetical protein [Natrinema sp. J7-1]
MTDPTRRTLLKGIASASTIAGISAIGSAKTRRDMTNAPPESPFDFEYRTVGDDVRDAVGHLWGLLTVDHDRINELLEKSPTSTKGTRQKQETVDELRSTYEVELERDEENERELTYHFTESRVSALQEAAIGQDTLKESKNGKEAIKSVAESVSAGLQQEVEPATEPMHAGTIHEEMAATAIEGTDHSAQKTQLKDGSTDPDQWPQKCRVCSNDWMSLGGKFDLIDISPDTAEEKIRKKIRDIDDSASPHHMYVPEGQEFEATFLAPSSPGYLTPVVEVTGAAPREAQQHWENATSGKPTDFRKVGRAFHFMQDVSQPLHTGAIGPQILETQGTIHEAYAEFIKDNWENADDTSKAFLDKFNEGIENPGMDGSMEEACKAIANDSSNYSEQVYETIVENGPENRDDWDDFVENSAHACMWLTGSYSRGALNQL